MSQPISQTQKISAVVLSISLCASTVFAYQKQQTPQQQTRRVSAVQPSNPRLDAAQIAALDAEANNKANSLAAAQQTAFNTEVDAVAQRHFQTPPNTEMGIKSGTVLPVDIRNISGLPRTSTAPVDQSEPPRLMADREGIQQAVSLGLLRVATERDVELYIESYNKFAAPQGRRLLLPTVYGEETSYNKMNTVLGHNNGYVILKNMRIPEGMGGANAVTFILPTGVPYPKGELGHSVLLNMNDGSCSAVVRELCTRRD